MAPRGPVDAAEAGDHTSADHHRAPTSLVVGRNVTCVAQSSYVGTDSFEYEICAVGGACDRATVTVTVTPSSDLVTGAALSRSPGRARS